MDDGDFVGDSDEDERELDDAPLAIEYNSVSTGEKTALGVDETGGAVDIASPIPEPLTPHDPVKEGNLPTDVVRESETVVKGVALVNASERMDVDDEPIAAPVNASIQHEEPTPSTAQPEPQEVSSVREELPAKDVPMATPVNAGTQRAEPMSPTAPSEPREVLNDRREEAEPNVEPMDIGPRAKFKVGDTVHVAARTWPGINKLGGAGKIVSIITEATDDGVAFLYNVKYMLGGFERRIEEEFIQYLQDALETGVRQHKERVFYHDEFVNDPHKRRRAAMMYNTTMQQPQVARDMSKGDHSIPHARTIGDAQPSQRKHKKVKPRDKPVLEDAPKIESHERSSDDSDYDESEEQVGDIPSDDLAPTRRLDDRAFFLDEDHTSGNQQMRDQERRKKTKSYTGDVVRRKSKHDRSEKHRAQEEPRPRKKRLNRIIESDGEEDDEASSPVERHVKHKHRSKKRRYIGGYEHGSADADGSFIQPEGNPAALPDDVAKELQLKLGATKAELRAQLETVADRLLSHLSEFENTKTEISERLEVSVSLDELDLQDVNQKLLEAGEFVRTKFIRSGEDAMNLIIKMLEKKGASLPDRIDLQFEDWKQRIAEHDTWVKHGLRALGAKFHRRGFRDAFVDKVEREETSSSGSDSSSESAHSDQDDFEMLDDNSRSPRSDQGTFTSLTRAHQNQRPARTRVELGDSHFSSSTNTGQRVSKKRPRSSIRTQSSMDAFAVPVDEIAREKQFRSTGLTTSNFRFVRGRDMKILKDPRWDWARTLHRNRSSANSFSRPGTNLPPSSHSSSTYERSSKSRNTSESVMEAVFKLRDKRYRDRSIRRTSTPQSRVVYSSNTLVPESQSAGSAKYARMSSKLGHSGDNNLSSSTVEGEPVVILDQEPREWKSIFDLRAEENIPVLQIESSVLLGKILQDPEMEGEEAFPCLKEVTAKSVVFQMATIRQKLSTLRGLEWKEMNDIREKRREGEDVFHSDSWFRLSAFGDEFHTELLLFVNSLRQGLREVHSSNLKDFVESTVSELSVLLKQIPDCATMFGNSPSYGYFFVVASPGARTTPLITAICRTYWYAIQLLISLKTICERCRPESRREWELVLANSLSPSRVALSCSLFLIDLYIHIRSTHRFTEENTSSKASGETAVPSLSLWQLLNDLFSSGAIQSNKDGEITSLWHLLQAAYKQGLVDLVAVSCMKGESFGGYVQERSPPKLQGSDEDLQGKLLAADVLWDLSCVLGSLFHPTVKSRQDTLLASWNLVRELLSADRRGFIPLSAIADADTTDEDYQLQAHGFKLRVLRRLLVLSAIWPPQNDILEKTFLHLWDSVLEDEDQAVLSSVVDFIGDVRQLEDKSNDGPRYALAQQHAARTTNSVELYCKIAVLQLSRLEKTIHRVRYRQPVLRAISGRIDKHRATLEETFKLLEQSTAAPAATNGSKKSWNWTKSGNAVIKNAGEESVKPKTTLQAAPVKSTPRKVVVEIHSAQSIVLMFGVAALYLDEESGPEHQQARRKRDLKREIDFLCKELSSVSCDVPDTSARLCECLSAVGTVALDVGASYSTPFERIGELMKWTAEKIHRARQNDADSVSRASSSHIKQLQATASSCLRAMRDLSSQFFNQLGVRPLEADETESCISAALGSGLAAFVDLIVEDALSQIDLDLGVELMMLWMPKRDIVPSTCLQFANSNMPSSHDEFDEFDDPEMMDLLAAVDLEAATSTATANEEIIRGLQDRARAFAGGSLRLSIQKLVVSFPQKRWRTYQELYMIDLMGSMISASKSPFSWATVSLISLKHRMLAPRLMGSILQHQGESDWFSTCFLSEQNADGELASMWVTATLDLRSLFPTVCKFPALLSDGTSKNTEYGVEAKSAKYSSYWLSLTDAILVRVLKQDPVVRYKMDQLMFRLLEGTATSCSYAELIRESSDPKDVKSLYSMHVDVFRAFCRSAGHIWHTLSGDPVAHRQDMNRFRSKMMDTVRGVFVTLPEAYEINLRGVCQELDRKNINWYSLSGRFLDEFTSQDGSTSLHTVDDAASMLDRELTDPAIRPMIILFKFMYDCVDSFLFNCGGMAIGQQNIFYSIIELMFRQARCAEFPTAEKRLKQTSASNLFGVGSARPSTASSLTGVSPACAGFTESVRLFFAYQKYPSLLNWFTQNLDTYQTLKAGWMTSPLRVLLYNVFDPHGPLGIHSYYPMQDDARHDALFDPRTIRREAFYLACGLLHCRCTTSYEHTRCAVRADHEERRSQLRRYVLFDFVTELSIAAAVDGENKDESVLPNFQLVKAYLNHLNLVGAANLQESPSENALDVAQDLIPCIVKIGKFAIPKLREKESISDVLSCIILIEFVCILDELFRVNNNLRDARILRFINIGLRCAAFAYSALRSFSATPLEQLFTDECLIAFNVDEMMSELTALAPESTEVKTEPNVIDVKVEPSHATRSNPEDYGIGKARVRSDLLAVIRRLVRTCNEHTQHPLIFRATQDANEDRVQEQALPQLSVEGTM